ncbi:MAG TPA: hypothetical protein VLU25_14710 [Acidobacteriota bacterium]|nr:hypothetical protein [Acidobacteriota bacterium]
MRIPGIDISAHTVADLYTSQAPRPNRAARPRVEKIDELDRHNQLKSRRRTDSGPAGGNPSNLPTIRRFDTYDLKARSSDVPLTPGRILNIRA